MLEDGEALSKGLAQPFVLVVKSEECGFKS